MGPILNAIPHEPCHRMRIQPCQGWGRGFESHRPLQIQKGNQLVIMASLRGSQLDFRRGITGEPREILNGLWRWIGGRSDIQGRSRFIEVATGDVVCRLYECIAMFRTAKYQTLLAD